METILKSKEEALKHPFVRKIPWHVWEMAEIFNYRASEAELQRMGGSVESASKPLQPKEKPIKAMLCFIYGHNELSSALLLKAGHRMNCSDSTIAKAALLSGRAELFAETPIMDIRVFNRFGARHCLDHYWAYRYAAKNGDLAMLKHLELRMSARQRCEALVDNSYGAYADAALCGHLPILVYLESHMDDRQKCQVLEYEWCPAHFCAVIGGHLAILVHLESRMNDRQMRKAIKASVYQRAFKHQHSDVLNHLLGHAWVFAYAEQHVREYSENVRPFAQGLIHKWQTAYERFQADHPNDVFNLGENEVELGFYLARHLIRENTPTACEQLGFLLGIPGIANSAHRAVTLDQPNELLRLAMRLSNQSAAEILLTQTPVRELAVQHNYYVGEMRGTELDLHALAQDRESSLRALSKPEKRRILRLKEHYAPLINKLGDVNNLLAIVRNNLHKRYRENPARIVVNEQDTVLPLGWEAFQRLNLQGNDYRQALEAYYQNDDHAALRWLLKPNPWMAGDAAYVRGNAREGRGYSTFEDYQSLIALFWLAASDENTRATDGHTLEGRMDNFIKELALIGRAHNWDRVRFNNTINAIEEYDDLTGDKPSCYSGVKRRLFQSLIGHPLLRPLNEDILEEEIRELARAHFIKCLNSYNLPLLLQVKAALTEGDELNEEQKHAMKSLDIPAARCEAFILSLQAKYAEEWSENYTQYLRNRFSLADGDATHVNQFWLLTDFNALLEQPLQSSVLSPTAVWGLFARAAAQASEFIEHYTGYFNG